MPDEVMALSVTKTQKLPGITDLQSRAVRLKKPIKFGLKAHKNVTANYKMEHKFEELNPADQSRTAGDIDILDILNRNINTRKEEPLKNTNGSNWRGAYGFTIPTEYNSNALKMTVVLENVTRKEIQNVGEIRLRFHEVSFLSTGRTLATKKVESTGLI